MFVADDTSGFGYFTNFGRTRRQGGELGLNAKLGAFDVGANYTFLDATYRSAEEVAGEGNSTNEEGGASRARSTSRRAIVSRSSRVTSSRRSWLGGCCRSSRSTWIRSPSRASSHAATRTTSTSRMVCSISAQVAQVAIPCSPSDSIYQPLPALYAVRPGEQPVRSRVLRLRSSARRASTARAFSSPGRSRGPIVDGERPLLGSTFGTRRTAPVLGGNPVHLRQVADAPVSCRIRCGDSSVAGTLPRGKFSAELRGVPPLSY